jgi:hypothetical protein
MSHKTGHFLASKMPRSTLERANVLGALAG